MTNLPLLFSVCFASTLALVWVAIHYLRRKMRLDMPDGESGNTRPVPRGGGMAVMPVIYIGMAWLYFKDMLVFPQPLCWTILMSSGLALGFVLWIDDKRKDKLAARYRLTIQLLAVALPLVMLPSEWRVFPNVMPVEIERIVLGAIWLWMGNLFNFMDGINGITGMQSLAITLGTVLLVFVSGIGMETGLLEMNIIIAGSVAGFLFWNLRPQARAFLGDIGSVGLGYVLGWMLIMLAIQGHVLIALILPLVYWVDGTVTLIKRAIQGKKIWKSHRDHFYQEAVHPTGLTHLQAVAAIAVTNAMLLIIAMSIVQHMIVPMAGIAIAFALVAFLLFFFHMMGRRARWAVEE